MDPGSKIRLEPIQEPGSAPAKPLGSLGSLSGPRVAAGLAVGRPPGQPNHHRARLPDRSDSRPPNAALILKCGLKRRAEPGVGDGRDVADVGAAAATEDARFGSCRAVGVAPAEVGGIAVVEILGLVQLGMAAGRGVGAQAAQPPEPRAAVASAPAKWVGWAQLIM